MKPKTKTIVIALPIFVATLLLLVGIRGVSSNDDQVIAKTTLSDGTVFALIARDSGNVLDGFDLSLYQRNPAGNFLVAFVGNEESFWWGASLRLSDQSNSLQVIAFGQPQATLHLTNGTYDIPSKGIYRKSMLLIDDVQTKHPIPDVLRANIPDRH